MDGMARRVGRMAQAVEPELEAAPLQAEDFLGDKGLGQPRIALEDDGDRRGVARAARAASSAVRR
jgi:hypothetical protein